MDIRYIDRFWSKVSKVPDANGCLNWTASHRNGYGVFGEYKKVHDAHRLAWKLTHGDMQPGMYVCHRCDNRSCCNVEHLFLGTPMDNMRDKMAKGRQLRGEQNSLSTLTAQDIVTIRALCDWSGFKQMDVAAEYGVSRSLVCGIVNRKRWSHVQWP
jgi:HNH endonuclease